MAVELWEEDASSYSEKIPKLVYLFRLLGMMTAMGFGHDCWGFGWKGHPPPSFQSEDHSIHDTQCFMSWDQ